MSCRPGIGTEQRETEQDIPKYACDVSGGGDGQARDGKSDHNAQAPLRAATGMPRTCRQTSGFDPRIGDPERARRHRCAGDSVAADPRPSAAPNPIRRAVHVIGTLPIRNMKELRGGTQLLPQFLCAGIATARFRRCVAFHHQQDRTQGTTNFELLSLTLGVVWQQRQLVQPFCNCTAASAIAERAADLRPALPQ
jgi:hypothetical protein